jgi:hypothetical protein
VNYPNFTMTEDRKKERSMRRCPPIGTLAANLRGARHTPNEAAYWGAYTTRETDGRTRDQSRMHLPEATVASAMPVKMMLLPRRPADHIDELTTACYRGGFSQTSPYGPSRRTTL